MGILRVSNFFKVSVVCICMHLSGIEADTLISADNPHINYYGRFDFTSTKAPRFNWSGTTIELKVNGTTTVGVELIDGAGYFDIEIDGKVQATPLFADSYASKKYTLTSALTSASHVIRIVRRNEPYWVIATFKGFYLSDGAVTQTLDKPVRKMEFCGDSWTAGYFIESCADQQMHTNANKSWARLTSKAFKAQDVILAESGIGLVKSLGGKTSLPQKYLAALDTMGGAASPRWNFASWIPDIVSIFLGINDKSSGATDNEYSAAVHSFVTTIRNNYPSTPILFISYGGCMDNATKAAVAAETTSLNHKNVYYMECKQQVKGCSWHPDTIDSRVISDSVIVKIKEILGWDTSLTSAVSEPYHVNSDFSQINISQFDNRMIRITCTNKKPYTKLTITNAAGVVIHRLQNTASNEFWWDVSNVSNGVYFISSDRTGQTRVVVKR
jgi:lysophospholipase L1-like esterase